MSPANKLLVGFLVLLGALAALVMPSPWPVLGAAAGMIAAIYVTGRLRERSPFDVLHAFLPVPIAALLVNVVGPVIEHANKLRWDAQLAALDSHSFGPLLSAWRHAGGRPDWLTDFASIAYASYYLLPVIAAGVLWARGAHEEFDRFVFSLCAVLLASYLAYFIAPAAGPRVPDELAQSQLGGGAVSAALRAFLHTCERNQLDAFPSGHTAVSLAFLAQSWKIFPRWRVPLSLAVGAIIFSTVYLSLHYIVDVFAGAALTLLMLPALPWLRMAFGMRAQVRWRAA